MDPGGEATERLIAAAGIKQGSRALDVGCGGGAVTFRLSKAVGVRGHVLGIDPSRDALNVARRIALNQNISNVSFAECDLLEFACSREKFDVVMCRRVLMYLPRQDVAAKALKSLLKPNGILVIQEHDASMLHSTAPVPLFLQARLWILETLKFEGANPHTGFDLHSILAAAGFSEISISAEATVETPTQGSQMAAIIRAMIPRIEAASVATANEIDIDTLEDRLQAERNASGATTIGEVIFGALAR